MISNELREKLQNIVRGNVPEGQEDHCTAVSNLLVQSFGSDPTVKGAFESRSIFKKEQELFLKAFAKAKKFLDSGVTQIRSIFDPWGRS